MAELTSIRERVKAKPAERLVQAYYRQSVPRALEQAFTHEMQVHLAHAVMLAEREIVARESIGRVLRAVLELAEAGAGALDVDYSQEDLYSYVERHLIAAVGSEDGGRLHTGRSRNDLNVTTWRMALRQALIEAMEALCELRQSLLSRAEAHAETVMPGYTHSQHAQPVTFGYYCEAAAAVLARDFDRLRGALAHVDLCPLGAGALATTGFPIDRQMTADLLGFAGLVENAYDAVSSRDDIHETASALAVCMTNVSRIAVDLQAWNMREHGFIELGDAYSSVSSIMPQKKNPQALEHTKAAAGTVTGALVAALSMSKNTSLSDTNDGVTAPNKPVMEAAAVTRDALRLMAGVVDTLTVHPEAMLQAAEDGFGTATELADVIVRATGLPFRTAHGIVARAVAAALAKGQRASEITAGDIAAASRGVTETPVELDSAIVAEALDPARNIRVRTVTGGPAPDLVRSAAAGGLDRLAADRASIRQARERADGARSALMRKVEALLPLSRGS